jgi:hypothetical protein
MGQAIVDNGTPFAVEPLFLADEEGRPLLVPIVKGTWSITARGLALSALSALPALPELADEQVAVKLAGELSREARASRSSAAAPRAAQAAAGDDADAAQPAASYRYEPECAFIKLATDVVLTGSACASHPGTTELLVAFQVGALRKGVRVVGDRAFYKAVGGVGMTKPLPFERLPLVWERAFGGWDRSHPDEAKHELEPRNPVGVGFRAKGSRFEEGLRCPNLEDPARPLRGFGDRPPPCATGFVSPDFQPRAGFAGTYDDAWQKQRAPLLPRDFDRRFFNAAPPGLIAAGYLRGDEQVAATGVTPSGGVAFRLPGVAPPQLRVEHAGRADLRPAMRLDTVIVDTDAGRLFLLWRAQAAVREPGAVRTIQVLSGAGTPARTVA